MKCSILVVVAFSVIAGNDVGAQSCSGVGNGYHVNPTNCTKYFYCSNGIITNYDCEKSDPGWAKDFFCGTLEETKAIASSPTVTSIQNPNKTWKNLCRVIGAQGWFADSSTCNRYFRCYRTANGNIAQTVMDITGMCASSEFVKRCNAGGIPSNPNLLCANKTNGYYAVTNSCNKYYHCSQKKATVYQCSNPLNASSVKTFFCGNSEEQASIIGSAKVRSIQLNSGVYRNQCSNEGWMSDSANCNLYFYCYRNNNGILSQTKIDVTGICETSDYVQKCQKTVDVSTESSTTETTTTTTKQPEN